MKTLFAIFAILFGSPEPAYSQSDVSCMAHAVYHEARGESIKGQEAVAHVVLNRSKSDMFPNSICGVVYQPHQFTNIKQTKPRFDSLAWNQAMLISAKTLAGLSKDPTNGAKYFYAHMKVKPKWSESKLKIKIGNHSFL